MSPAPTSPNTPSTGFADGQPPLADSVAAEVAAALLAGDLAVLPTETVYGLCCAASSPRGIAKLLEARHRLGGLPAETPMRPVAWLAAQAAPVFTPPIPTPPVPAPSTSSTAGTTDAASENPPHGRTEAVLSLFRDIHPVHRRLITRLAPGPVTFIAEWPEAALQAARERLHCARGVIDEMLPTPAMIFRAPMHTLTRQIAEALEAAGSGLLADSIPTATGKPSVDGDDAIAALAAVGIYVAQTINRGRCRYGIASTRIRLTAAGGYAILSEGVVGRQTVERAAKRSILFVCTGNTCRSAMAQAIAIAELAAAGISDVDVKSAGIAAAEGEPPTPEGVIALAKLGVRAGSKLNLGVSTGQEGGESVSGSRQVTVEMIARADAVFVMTNGHRLGVGRLLPMAQHKICLLDPSGADVPDPIGGPQSLYDATAGSLRGFIRARLKELPS